MLAALPTACLFRSVKIKAHPPDKQSSEAEHPVAAFEGNRLADEQAKAAAARQPYHGDVSTKWTIQRELACQITARAVDPGHRAAAPAEPARELRPEKALRLTFVQRLRRSAHRPVAEGDWLRCTRCFGRSPPGGHQRRLGRWLASRCEPGGPRAPHPTHKIGRVPSAGIIWCQGCGALGQKVNRKLLLPRRPAEAV